MHEPIAPALDHVPQVNTDDSSAHRSDIDGLRAIAVLCVIGFHAFPHWVRGGFVGVDIFFVISGFLISRMIFSGLEAGSFNFFEFYGRRIRRIFPALALILFASYVFGWFALFPHEYAQLGKYIAAGAGFVSNIVLSNESGYFDNFAETKPLLHLWSLGIEEQFYLIWPLSLWLAWRFRIRILGFTLVITAASFALNIFGVFIDDVSTFYSPQTRFWELLIGSLLAWGRLHASDTILALRPKVAGRLGKVLNTYTGEVLSARVRHVQSWAGACLIIFAVLVLTKANRFPGWWASLPTIGAALIIAGGPGSGFNRKVLCHPLMVWLGLISYPLYLWHWPLLSFARIVVGEVPAEGIRIAAVALSVTLAWLTCVLIETPIRRGGHAALKVTVLVVVIGAAGGVGYACYRSHGLMDRASIKNAEAVLSDLSWAQEENFDPTCRKYFPKFDYCRLALDAQPTIALIGDSQANQFFLGLAEQYRKKNENLVMLGRAACPPLMDILSSFRGKVDRCGDNSSDAIKEIANLSSVRTVILAGNWHLYINGSRFAEHYRTLPPWEIRTIGKPTEENNVAVFNGQLKKTIEFLELHSKKVIVVRQIPELNYEVSRCLVLRPIDITTEETRCETASGEVKAYLDEYSIYFDRVLADEPSVAVWDPYPYFCDNRKCISITDGKPLYRDDVHLSKLGSKYFARRVLSTP